MSVCPVPRGVSRAFLIAALLSSTAWAAAPPVPIVFVARPNETQKKVRGVMRAEWGQLRLLFPSGDVRVLVDGKPDGGAGQTLSDISDPDVSWDLERVVFSGLSVKENAWRIFEVNLDGTGLRQVTISDRAADLARHDHVAALLEDYDDLDPCYLPDGRICFVSTRYPEIALERRERATNLHIVNADGTGLYRLTTERFAADTPAVDPLTGKIIYSRWWRTARHVDPETGKQPPSPPPGPAGGYGGQPAPDPIETRPLTEWGEVDVLAKISETVIDGRDFDSFPGLNSWVLSSINPDGTGLQMLSGFHLDREAGQGYRPAVSDDGKIAALFVGETPVLGSAGRKGLRLMPRGLARPVPLAGPQKFGPQSIFTSDMFFQSVAWLPSGELLVSAAGSSNPSAFELLTIDVNARKTWLLGASQVVSKVDAVPVVARRMPPKAANDPPPRLPDTVPASVQEAYEAGGSFTFVCENIHANAPVGIPMAGAPPIGEPLMMEFYTSPQRTGNELLQDPPLLIHSVEVPPSGRVRAELPVGVPLFEALRRKDRRLAVGRDGQIFHVGGFNFATRGAEVRCVGCHAGHSTLEVPEEPGWTNVAPSAKVMAPGFETSVVGKSVAFAEARLVDRSTGARGLRWQREKLPGMEPMVTLRFPVEIEVREIALHGFTEPATDTGGREVSWTFTATLRRGPATQAERHVSGHLSVDATRLRFDPPVTADQIELVAIGVLSGSPESSYEGSSTPGLAEIEVIARIADGTGSRGFGIRGDGNCDEKVDLSDALVLVGSLFEGAGRLCCGFTGDANSDAALDLADPIYILLFLFRGGPPPAAPFPQCGELVLENWMVCGRDACPR